MYILHIEDEPSDAALVDRYLRTTSHQYQNATTIETAWEMLQNQPDIVLVDMILNHARNGFKFVQDLRHQGYQKPIVAITGLVLDKEIKQCYSAGCNAVLIKPFSINELITILDKYIS
jgi:two-component system, sensor histidine kinase